ncbi:MAG: helix-turn-helix transcriptional regulator [Lachnospiraceae bacterium]|nr:helix-turn-helix transcriptional regulator [Lachnospiraceae bacterium]MBP3608782.1 helix-turn-helix transcriptional regulator [Lachnospiraceae bacterium]
MKNQNPKKSSEKLVEKSTRYIDVFRRNIDKLMEENDYTIKETAEIADISYDTLKTFLYDKEAKDCRLSTAVKLARAFHISIDELVGAGTIDDHSLNNMQIYRSLPKGSRSLIDWHLHNQKFIHEKHKNKKIVNIMLPVCANSGNLKITSDYEPLHIEHMDDELFHKVFIGIQIPCLHYLPHYTQGDILLLANDRDAMRGENTVVVVNDNLAITNRVIENGIVKYYGIRDGKFRIAEPDNVEVLGYVAKILRA